MSIDSPYPKGPFSVISIHISAKDILHPADAASKALFDLSNCRQNTANKNSHISDIEDNPLQPFRSNADSEIVCDFFLHYPIIRIAGCTTKQ